eukprot:Awhi_evm1s4281
MIRRKAGMIIDDELHAVIVKPLPRGSKLVAVMDCCHSGTGLDLPYSYEWRGNKFKKTIEKSAIRHGRLATAHCTLFSGCADNQTSADTAKLSGGTFTGAMTYAFIQSIEKYYPNLTYSSLIRAM